MKILRGRFAPLYMLWQCGVERTAAVKSRRHRSDSDPQHQFSVDALAMATDARCVQRSSTLQARWFDS